jgi:hypothetical protein
MNPAASFFLFMMKEKFPRATPEIPELRIQSDGFG